MFNSYDSCHMWGAVEARDNSQNNVSLLEAAQASMLYICFVINAVIKTLTL